MEEPKDEVATGIVMYTDGGCRPTNPGPGGYGVHGYMYTTAPPKKGTGLGGIVLTAEGYVVKDVYAREVAKLNKGDHDEETLKQLMEDIKHLQTNADATVAIPVTPVHYFDGYGALPGMVSNNYAELMGTTRGLQASADHVISRVRIFTDSEYVCKGLEKWARDWERNGWKKRDGTEPANVHTWKELLAAHTVLVERGVDVKVQWIKGHADHLGNEMADTLATLGIMHNRKEGSVEVMDRSPAEGYWSYDAAKHPFISHRRLYFNTVADYGAAGHYYLGDHGKDDEMLGKRISDGCYSVIRLKEPDSIIELLRDHQTKMAGDTNNVAMIRLDQMYRPDTHNQLTKYGHYATEKVNPRRDDLYCLDREPLTRVLDPARLAHRAIETITSLEEKLDWYVAKDARLATTDLTSILYETGVKTSKKGEVTTFNKLKDEYTVGFAALKVEANYPSADGVKVASITVNMGIDALDRNALRRLEDTNPTVTLISWMDSPTVFRYATVVESGEDIGIWAGVYSNVRLVSE